MAGENGESGIEYYSTFTLDQLMTDILDSEVSAEGLLKLAAPVETRLPEPSHGLMHELQGDAFGTFRRWILDRHRS